MVMWPILGELFREGFRCKSHPFKPAVPAVLGPAPLPGSSCYSKMHLYRYFVPVVDQERMEVLVALDRLSLLAYLSPQHARNQ